MHLGFQLHFNCSAHAKIRSANGSHSKLDRLPAVETLGNNRGAQIRTVLSKLPHFGAMLAILAVLSACQMNLKTSTEYLISGNEYFKGGDYKNAESDYRTALKLDPSSATAKNNLGVILNEQGQYDEAVAILREAIQADPKNSIAHYVLAKSLIKKGLYDEAMQEAQTATELDKTEPAAYKALAEAALAKGATDVAINAYRCSVRLDPENDEYHHDLAKALGDSADIDGQIAEEKKCLELNPDNKEAKTALEEAMQQRSLGPESDNRAPAEAANTSPRVSDARLRMIKTPH